MIHSDVIVVGSGLGSLTCAALLSQKGLKVTILEQNYLPGGCTSSYWRKGFVFETGATTVVGMDNKMPLDYFCRKTGIHIPMRKLGLPMKVHLKDGTSIRKEEDIKHWINVAENEFGKGQRKFWEKAYEISQFVWDSSTRYKTFPPRRMSDFFSILKNFKFQDLRYFKYIFQSVDRVMRKFGVNNSKFSDYVDEQLLITAQNNKREVNFLFGSAALCYTNYSNFYVDGGLINLVKPIIEFIEKNNGTLQLKTNVRRISKRDKVYKIETEKGEVYSSEFLISGIPINNTLELFAEKFKDINKRVFDSGELNSAFQMGIGFKSSKKFETLHHQIHLNKPLSGLNSKSIFLSISHENDDSRADMEGCRVASVSTHIGDPEKLRLEGKTIEKEIINLLEEKGFLRAEDIIYAHSSTQKSWEKWTGRKWGFVGGYPQFMKVKPWQMLDSRLDGRKAYICGDTTYPGQGIPGTTLSGIVAFEKLKSDWL